MHIENPLSQDTILKKFFFYSYLFGIFFLAVSLPFSEFLMSLAQIILFLTWILDGRLLRKLEYFIKNRTAVIISSLFVLHLAGLIYTSDFTYGLEDVKKKIPLLLLPMIFSTSAPLSKKMFEHLLSVFIFSVTVAVFICFFILLGYTQKQVLQPQQASVFISHIRFGLLISLSIFMLCYFFTTKKSVVVKISILFLIIWLILFMIMLESATGLVCTVVVSCFFLIKWIFRRKGTFVKITLFATFLIGAAWVINLSHNSIKGMDTAENKNTLPAFTKRGNPYFHDTINKETENGNYVWKNICEMELSEEWNKVSPLDYQGKDLQGNELKYTLIRFLSSKGLNKDAEGVQMLTQQEVRAVEKGIPNVDYIAVFNPTARIQKIIWEFDLYFSGGNPSGHSVIQRFEFWKAAIDIIRENFWFGVGTGDVKNAFDEQYKKTNSPLAKEWRLRSHNQFLAMGTAFGITGICWFLISLFYPLFAEKKFSDYFYIPFFIIAFLSMLTEDTLETQAGVTFFAFFNSLFLFLDKEHDLKE